MSEAISRQDAVAAGLSKFFHGRACKRGHISERYVASGSCVQCHLTHHAGKYWSTRDRSAYQAGYYKRIREQVPERIMLQTAKGRAKALGLPFAIQISDVVAAWPEGGLCPVLRIPLRRNFDRRGGSAPDSPSLDRIVPARGYVPGNIAIISMRANWMKSETCDPAAFRRMADWLERVL